MWNICSVNTPSPLPPSDTTTHAKSDAKDFWVNMPNLISHLKKVAEQKPQATYYNVDMLKYQVSSGLWLHKPDQEGRKDTATGASCIVKVNKCENDGNDHYSAVCVRRWQCRALSPLLWIWLWAGGVSPPAQTWG